MRKFQSMLSCHITTLSCHVLLPILKEVHVQMVKVI